jgi:hypothetical protein
MRPQKNAGERYFASAARNIDKITPSSVFSGSRLRNIGRGRYFGTMGFFVCAQISRPKKPRAPICLAWLYTKLQPRVDILEWAHTEITIRVAIFGLAPGGNQDARPYFVTFFPNSNVDRPLIP